MREVRGEFEIGAKCNRKKQSIGSILLFFLELNFPWSFGTREVEFRLMMSSVTIKPELTRECDADFEWYNIQGYI